MRPTQSWSRALVTGASGGIGEAYARALSARGTALVLVARRADRLETLAAELDTEVEVLAADLAEPEGRAPVEARLAAAEAPVDLLVNNAGFGTTGVFAELDVEREDEEIRLNVLALMRLTRAALPGMLERRHGGVVNLGSVAAFVPAAKSATYAASKAFVLSFTEALSEEVRGTGVRVQCLCPGLTRTEFQSTADYDASGQPGFMWQSADSVVGESLSALGRGKVVCVTGLQNRSMVVGTSLVPRVAKRRLAALVSGQGK
jgi:short-subunit dehydrogenase